MFLGELLRDEGKLLVDDFASFAADAFTLPLALVSTRLLHCLWRLCRDPCELVSQGESVLSLA